MTANVVRHRADWRAGDTGAAALARAVLPPDTPPSAKAALGRLCAALRLAAGLTTRRLAERLGWNQAQVSRLESAQGGLPKLGTLAELGAGTGSRLAIVAKDATGRWHVAPVGDDPNADAVVDEVAALLGLRLVSRSAEARAAAEVSNVSLKMDFGLVVNDLLPSLDNRSPNTNHLTLAHVLTLLATSKLSRLTGRFHSEYQVARRFFDDRPRDEVRMRLAARRATSQAENQSDASASTRTIEPSSTSHRRRPETRPTSSACLGS
jgi:transcriptional regulator with XRE-family HTH domain